MTEPDGTKVRIIACPKCKRSTRFDATNEFRPFCSKRCKDADIVAWADEGYRVAGEATSEEPEATDNEDGE